MTVMINYNKTPKRRCESDESEFFAYEIEPEFIYELK